MKHLVWLKRIKKYTKSLRYSCESRFWLTWWKCAKWYRPLLWKLRGRPILNVCDHVEYSLNSFNTGPQFWRVDGWLRRAKKPTYSKDSQDVISEILFEGCRKIDNHRMQWCLKSEATHVALSGICGTIAPISLCRFIGKIGWTPKDIAEAEAYACQLGKAGDVLF